MKDRFETEEGTEEEEESDNEYDEQGFIVNGRRMLRPNKITGSVVSKADYLMGSVDNPATFASLLG